MIEEMLLAPFLPVMSVFKLKTDQNTHRGYVASFRQESAAFYDKVPRLADRIPITAVKPNGQGNMFVAKSIVHGSKLLEYFCYSTTPNP